MLVTLAATATAFGGVVGTANAQDGQKREATAPVMQAQIATVGAIADGQVVTVSWSGFTTTRPDPQWSFQSRDEVGIYECSATTPDGFWFYYRDCFTALPPNAYPHPGSGNMVDPTNTSNPHGVTLKTGTGQQGFQVLTGTLHTDPVVSSQSSFNVQCDITHACVLKVVDFGKFFRKNTIPNLYQQGFNPTGTGDWSDLVDQAPSVPIDFASSSVCPPPSASTPQLRIQGAPSSSYAIEKWSSGLCTGSHAVQVDYAQLGEDLGRQNLESGTTDVALGALSPTTSKAFPGYIGAPVDVSGVAIAFNMIDDVTGAPITQLRLTPRLVAMLVTDSAVHAVAGFPAADYYPLTGDPEFVALNPGFHFPADPIDPTSLGVVEPILEGYQGDDTQILTSWIAADADAVAFLQGHDVCGAKLNPNWAGVSYPTSILRDLERDNVNPALPLSGYYNPITNLATEVADVFYGKVAGYLPPSLGAPVPMPPLNTQANALFGIFDTTSAARSGEPAASLLPASATSTIANYATVGASGCSPKTLTQFEGFVSPNPGTLEAGVAAMTANADGTLSSPVATTASDAYPLTKIDYAFAANKSLSASSAGALAEFFQYAGTQGQSATDLPFGYPPLPTYLQRQDAAAATIALALAPKPTPELTTTTTTTAPATSTTTTAPSANGSTSTSTPSSSNSTGPSSTSTTVASALPDNRGKGSGSIPLVVESAPQAVQAPVTIAAVVRTGSWVIPLAALLALLLGVLGVALLWPKSYGWIRRPSRSGQP